MNKELKPINLHQQKKQPGGFWVIIAFGFLLVLLFIFRSPSSSAINLVFNRDAGLQAENGRINVLLLGIPGENHDGPNLTDTIMVASYDLETKQINYISVPRDVWVDKYRTKINGIYQVGLNKGDGLGLAKEEVGNILGITVPYAVRLDFAGFIKAVDLVGGLDVDVEKSFDDYLYPNPGHEADMCGKKEVEMDLNEEQAKKLNVPTGKRKVLTDEQDNILLTAIGESKEIEYNDKLTGELFPCRFDHISFQKGLSLMDGATALKFVRSRHGTNNEGTDFARSKRQQLILNAFKDKVLSFDTLFDPGKMVNLVKTFDKSIDTDIPQGKLLQFSGFVKKMEKGNSLVIDSSGKDPLLVAPPTGQYGAWVLVPATGDYSIIHQKVTDLFSNISPASESAKPTAVK